MDKNKKNERSHFLKLPDSCIKEETLPDGHTSYKVNFRVPVTVSDTGYAYFYCQKRNILEHQKPDQLENRKPGWSTIWAPNSTSFHLVGMKDGKFVDLSSEYPTFKDICNLNMQALNNSIVLPKNCFHKMEGKNGKTFYKVMVPVEKDVSINGYLFVAAPNKAVTDLKERNATCLHFSGMDPEVTVTKAVPSTDPEKKSGHEWATEKMSLPKIKELFNDHYKAYKAAQTAHKRQGIDLDSPDDSISGPEVGD